MIHMLTTVDNPFDPSIQFEEWDAFDRARGYDTTGMLARIVNTSDELSEADQDDAIEQAIDEIVTENVTGLYRKIAVSEGV